MNHQAAPRPKILVLHPDPILRAGIAAAVREHAMFEVFVHGDDVPPHSDGIEVVVADYDHALLLTDVEARRSYGVASGAKILAFTTNDRELDIRRAIEAGVYGYLLTGGTLDELVDACRAVAMGQRYMSMAVAQRMAASLTRAALTSRELQVLRLVAGGHPNKAIARRLDIELGTVKSHVSAIMAKLGATSRTQAANIAAARGLVQENVEPQAGRVTARPAMFGSRLQAA